MKHQTLTTLISRRNKCKHSLTVEIYEQASIKRNYSEFYDAWTPVYMFITTWEREKNFHNNLLVKKHWTMINKKGKYNLPETSVLTTWPIFYGVKQCSCKKITDNRYMYRCPENTREGLQESFYFWDRKTHNFFVNLFLPHPLSDGALNRNENNFCLLSREYKC